MQRQKGHRGTYDLLNQRVATKMSYIQESWQFIPKATSGETLEVCVWECIVFQLFVLDVRFSNVYF